jgi:hypothetical protein
LRVCRSGPHDPRIPDAFAHHAGGVAPLAAGGHRFFQEIAFFLQDTRLAEVSRCGLWGTSTITQRRMP